MYLNPKIDEFTGIPTARIFAAHCAEADYVAIMCHEISTPLNVIIGLSQILATVECTAQKKEEYSLILRDSSTMITELLRNMLDSSKINAGMIEIEAIDFDLAKVIHEAAHIMTTKVAEKGLELFVHIGSGFPARCVGDPLRMRQILINLLGNAVKFTEKGHIALYADAKIDAEGNDKLHIAVVDTGIGINEDSFERIFAKYVQADASIGRIYGGTGLGLSISQELAHLMHGSIAVKSWPGVGTRFTVTLPLLKTQELANNN